MIVGADRQLKRCRACGQTKGIAAFHKDITKGDGRHNQCKDCRGLSEAARYDTNRTAILLNNRKHKAKRRVIWLRWKYDMSEDEYADLLRQQGGVCAICLQPESRFNGAYLSVDHNHSTEKVRGLLCRTCNSVLGLLNENPEIFRRAAAYLESGGVNGCGIRHGVDKGGDRRVGVGLGWGETSDSSSTERPNNESVSGGVTKS